MTESKNPTKVEDIGWNRFADFVDSLSHCLSKFDGTKNLLKNLIDRIGTNNRENVSLEYLLGCCKDVPSLDKAFEMLYDLIYKHEKYEKMFAKQILELSLDNAVSDRPASALFALSRIIRNHSLENKDHLRKAFMYRSMCYFLAKKLQDSYKDYLFSIYDFKSKDFHDDYFLLPEEHCDSLKAYFSEVSKEIKVQECLSVENIMKFIPRLKELFEEIRSKSPTASSSSSSKEDLFVFEDIQIEESWKDKGRAFIANTNVEPRTRMFEESPFAHIIYDIQRRCENCGKLLVHIEDYDSSSEEGNGLQISSFFPSFTTDSLVYCDPKCTINNRKSIKNSQLRPLLFELGVGSLPLRSILHDQNVSGLLNKWKLFQANPNDLEQSSKNDYLVFKLMNHISEHDKDNLASYAAITAFVVHCFHKHFVMITSEELDDFGKCFLHQLLTLSTNVITIQDQLGDEPVMIGVGIYPTIAILNHSCKPNVVPIFSGNRLILEALSPIDSGNEVLFCYDTDLKNMDLDERQTYFKNNYFFHCDCIACRYDQKDYSQAILCNFKPKEGDPCRKVAFIKNNDKVVCHNKPKHEMPVTEELLKNIEKVDEKYKFGNRMSQIFDQSEQADDATQAFLALNDAAKLSQQYLYSLHELSLAINRGMIKIYTSMGHYSRAISHSEYLIKTFRNHLKLSWCDLQHEIVKEFDRFIQLNLLEFDDNKPSKAAVEAFLKKIDSLEGDYEILKRNIGKESFESYYSGRIEKLDDYREQARRYL